jgi:AcrR family transcriptional regulator
MAPEGRPPTDERVLRATIEGLTALDPAALTIQQICRSAQVTPPTIYYRFGNKDGLLAAAVERLVSDWHEFLDADVSREGSLDETLAQATQAWATAITAPSRPITVFAWVTLLIATGSSESRDVLIQARDRSRSLVAERLRAHLGAGEADPLAGLIVDSLLAAALQYELDRDRDALGDRLDFLCRTVRLYVGVPSGAS